MKTIRLSYEDNQTQDLLKYLQGRVFHVTRHSSFTAIRRTRKVLHNRDGHFKINTSSHNSFGRLMGYVCLMDLRDHTPEVIQRIHDDYPFTGPHWFEITRKGSTISHLAYLFLDKAYYGHIIPNRRVHEHAGREGKYRHFVPYGEVWLDNHIPLEWIDSVLLVKRKTPAPRPTSMAGVLEAVHRQLRRKQRTAKPYASDASDNTRSGAALG